MVRLAQIAVVLVLVFAAAQFIRPQRTNPAIEASRTIEARLASDARLISVLHRACFDCHSNATAWARYSQIAPLSWVIASAVAEGRHALNFSEWADYPPEQQRALLARSCQDASANKMPPSVFTLLRPEARLSPPEIQMICAAAVQTP